MLRSTATKLARTLDSGRAADEWSDPAGERPRDGGDVDMLLTLLFSNFARRPRTPVGADMAGSKIYQSVRGPPFFFSVFFLSFRASRVIFSLLVPYFNPVTFDIDSLEGRREQEM